MESLVIDAHPCGVSIPEVLVAHEGKIKALLSSSESADLCTVVDDEGGISMCEFIPPLASFCDLSLADIYAKQLSGFRTGCEDVE